MHVNDLCLQPPKKISPRVSFLWILLAYLIPLFIGMFWHMIWLHHALLHHAQSQNSSTYVELCSFYAMNTIIEICVHFLTDQHIHQTKSSVDPSVCSYPSNDHRTWWSNDVHSGIHGTYHHLCRSDIPLEFLFALHCYLGHAYMWYAPSRKPAQSDNTEFGSHFEVAECSSRKINNWKYSTMGKCISAYSKLLILSSCQVDMLNILMCLFNKFLDKDTNLNLLTQNDLNIKFFFK